MLHHAFKEWAVICRALAEGRQAIILRKGGVAEDKGEFRLQHARFWLYPTYVHQQRNGIKPEAQPLLERAEAERPPLLTLRLSHFAEVAGVYHLCELDLALRLNDLHLWSEESVATRFAYRSPGLYALPVRIYQAPEAIQLPERAEYAGCKTWVELEQPLPTDRATPVLDEEPFQAILRTLDRVLKPRAGEDCLRSDRAPPANW